MGLKARQEDKKTKSTLTSDMSNTQQGKTPDIIKSGDNGLFHPAKNSQMDVSRPASQPIKPNGLFGNPLNDKKIKEGKNNLEKLTNPIKKPINAIKKPIDKPVDNAISAIDAIKKPKDKPIAIKKPLEKKLVDRKLKKLRKPIEKIKKPKPTLDAKPIKKSLLDFPRPVVKGVGRNLENSIHTTSGNALFSGHSELDMAEGKDINDIIGGRKLRRETFTKEQKKQIKNLGSLSRPDNLDNLENLKKKKGEPNSLKNIKPPTPTIDGFKVGEQDLGKEGIGLTFTGDKRNTNGFFSDVRPDKGQFGQNNLSSNIQPQKSILGQNNLNSNIQPQKSTLGQNNLTSDIAPKKVDMMGKNNLFGNKLNGNGR